VTRETHPLGCILGTLSLILLGPSLYLITLAWPKRHHPDPEVAATAKESLFYGGFWIAGSLLLLVLTLISFRHGLKVSREAP
jgi:hypothetical protein